MKWDLPDIPAALRSLLGQIPPGRVATYGDLAEALGSRAAARWVGEYLVDHRHEEGCPCHRVVRSTGEPGLYITRDQQEKRARLKGESIELRDGRIDLNRYRFDEFESNRPLQRLIGWQRQVPESVRRTPLREIPDLVAGVDVAYPKRGRAVGGYALVETGSGRPLWSTTVQGEAPFPYIPGFLAFREVPVLLQLLQAAQRAGRTARLVFVDGNGMLHPRRAGVATCFGVLADIATVGIGKKLLVGSVDLREMKAREPRPVVHRGEVIGAALKASDASRPVFVSPGQHIDMESSVRAALRLFCGHRVPEPVYLADSVCRRRTEQRAKC